MKSVIPSIRPPSLQDLESPKKEALLSLCFGAPRLTGVDGLCESVEGRYEYVCAATACTRTYGCNLDFPSTNCYGNGYGSKRPFVFLFSFFSLQAISKASRALLVKPQVETNIKFNIQTLRYAITLLGSYFFFIGMSYLFAF